MTKDPSTFRVTDLDIKEALRVSCGHCRYVGLIPAYVFYARCKTLALISDIVPRLKCSGCGQRGDRMTWEVTWNPEEHRPLADDPSYTRHKTEQDI